MEVSEMWQTLRLEENLSDITGKIKHSLLPVWECVNPAVKGFIPGIWECTFGCLRAAGRTQL